MKRRGPKPVRLPADAVKELLLVAASLDAQARSNSPRNARGAMKHWLEGMRRGLSDAAATARRRASRIKLAQQRKKAAEDRKIARIARALSPLVTER